MIEKQYLIIFNFIVCLTFGFSSECLNMGTAPFSGTIFIDPDIITPTDPSTFLGLYYNGTAPRKMYDRRIPGWVNLNPYLFPANFEGGFEIEIQVNQEFGNPKIAQTIAEKYATVIGRLSNQLRKDVETVWIHKGLKPFGGGNKNLLIHTDWSEKHYEKQGILEETFVHEASHTSLDSYHSNRSEWIIAQNKDCNYISSYAEDNPEREDIAESYLPYLAVRFKSARISKELKRKIERAIPNRIKYFDSMNFDMYPIKKDDKKK